MKYLPNFTMNRLVEGQFDPYQLCSYPSVFDSTLSLRTTMISDTCRTYKPQIEYDSNFCSFQACEKPKIESKITKFDIATILGLKTNSIRSSAISPQWPNIQQETTQVPRIFPNYVPPHFYFHSSTVERVGNELNINGRNVLVEQNIYSTHNSSPIRPTPMNLKTNTKEISKFRISKPKRVRTIFTSEQMAYLEESFAKNQYLVGEDRVKMAKILNLRVNQVKIWFQNRRIKWRKQSQQKESRQAGQASIIRK